MRALVLILSSSLAVAAEPPLAEAFAGLDRLRVLGWSADGNRLALGLTEREASNCEGARDFDGDGLAILEREGTVSAVRIRDGLHCPEPSIVRARVKEALGKLEAAGIDPTRTGRRVGFFKLGGERRPVDDAFEFAVSERRSPESGDEDSRSLEGSFQLHVGKKRLEAHDFSLTLDTAGGSYAEAEVEPAFVSPEGRTAFVFATTGTGDSRNGITFRDYVFLGAATAPPHPEPQPAPNVRAWSKVSRIETAGWGKSAILLRVFDGGPRPGAPPCPGYLDAGGKPFAGGLSLVVVERGVVIGAFRLQDDASAPGAVCTPAALARRRLAVAKAVFKEREIDLTRKGSMVPVEPSAEKRSAPEVRKDGTVITTTRAWRSSGLEKPVQVEVRTEEITAAEKTRTHAVVLIKNGQWGSFDEPPATATGGWQVNIEPLHVSPDQRITFVVATATRGQETLRSVVGSVTTK